MGFSARLRFSFPKISITAVIPDSLDNKKAQHPVGLFYIFDAFGITPVVPAFSVAVFSYSYLEHPALYVPMIGN